MKSHGRGKYDDACTLARIAAKADGALLFIFGGERGHGCAVQIPEDLIVAIPGMLRKLADEWEEDLKKPK